MQNETLKASISSGKLICFADDIMLISDNQEEFKTQIEALQTLSEHGLALNKDKSVVLTNKPDLKDVDQLEGVKVQRKIKYLGLEISCDKTQLVRDAKARCNQISAYMVGKI